MSPRTEFPSRAPEGICPGIWLDSQRNLRGGAYKLFHPGWAPCEMPLGHVVPECGPIGRFERDVRDLGKQACHVVEPGQMTLPPAEIPLQLPSDDPLPW